MNSLNCVPQIKEETVIVVHDVTMEEIFKEIVSQNGLILTRKVNKVGYIFFSPLLKLIHNYTKQPIHFHLNAIKQFI